MLVNWKIFKKLDKRLDQIHIHEEKIVQKFMCFGTLTWESEKHSFIRSDEEIIWILYAKN